MLLLAACSAGQRELRHALRAAGENRAELEAVLDHYRRSEADSLKLRAAEYLIRYLPWQRSYGPEMERLYDRIDSLVPLYENEDSLAAAVERTYLSCKRELVIRPDLQNISAEFLIRNIDQAFDRWTRPWARHIDFETFCECLLPYKCFDLQPMTDWRTELEPLYRRKLGRYVSEVWRENPRVAVLEVNIQLSAFKFSYRVESNPFPVFRATTFTSLPKGTCDEACVAAALVMRSKGIPVSIDFTPNWTARPKNHFWCAVLNQRHRNEPFSAYSQVMGDGYFQDRPLAKVFRVTYRPNKDVFAILRRDGWIPRSLSYPFTRDVTEIYVKADTVECPLYDLRGLDGTVYLAVYDNREWVPVCWGERHRGRARFERVGRRVLYMPVVYDGQHRQHPAGDPFYLASDGTMEFMRADTLHRRSVRLNRKYGIYEEINNIQHHLSGGVFSAADNPQFRGARDIALPADTLVISGEERVPWSEPYRYWRARSNDYISCDMAEVRFFDGERRLEPRLFPAPQTDGKPYWQITDDDALTFCPLREPTCRVGFDFGRPVRVTRIVWFRRSDGNDVYPGKEYSLWYWDDRRWNLVGRTRAGERPWVEFGQVPEEALLMLVCDTEGVQHRPFVYRGGEVLWR